MWKPVKMGGLQRRRNANSVGLMPNPQLLFKLCCVSRTVRRGHELWRRASCSIRRSASGPLNTQRSSRGEKP
jgi:hypothetical protein